MVVRTTAPTDALYVPLKISNTEFTAVVDTGSQITCLSLEAWESIKNKVNIEVRPYETKVRAANGAPLETVGYVDVPV